MKLKKTDLQLLADQLIPYALCSLAALVGALAGIALS